MSPPLLGVVEDEDQSNVTRLVSSASRETICQNSSALKERNYMGVSECSSVDSSTISTASEDDSGSLNLKATELRLGVPGSESPERDPELCLLSSGKFDEKPLLLLHPSNDNTYLFLQKTNASGNKRGFSDAMDEFSEGKFLVKSEANVMISSKPSPNSGLKTGIVEDIAVTNCFIKGKY